MEPTSSTGGGADLGARVLTVSLDDDHGVGIRHWG
jgi:hypothetical protein